MYEPFKEFPNFLADKFADEVFENNSPDPFHKRLMNIRSFRDLREYTGLSGMRCDENLLREGFMSKDLHDFLEEKLGKERLATYFSDGSKPKLSKADQELEDLATLLWGTVRDKNRINVTRLGKGNIK